jgi:hypothetical protein
MKRLLFGLPFLFTAVTVLAQATTDSPAQLSEAAAAGIFGGMCIFQLIGIALWLWAAIWVMKDAKRRNSPNATLVTVLTWIPFTWVIGLIVHLVTRPKTIPGSPNP